MVIKLCLQLWIKIAGDHGDQVVYNYGSKLLVIMVKAASVCVYNYGSKLVVIMVKAA